MAPITAIDRMKGRRRAVLTLDTAEPLTLRLDLILERRLEVGADVSDDLRAELEAEDQRRTAVEAALRLIAAGRRSEKDLRDRLRRRGLTRAAVDAAIGRMRELGYLDDAAFAKSWVDSRQAATPRSRRYLAFELQRRGVAREASEPALQAVSDIDAAYEAASRRLRQLRGLDYPTFQRRLGSFLASRGFGYGVARAVIDRCWCEVNDDPAGASTEGAA